MPAITTNDLKNGITLELDNGLFQVVEFQHVKPGKGGAFVRTKLRNVTTGNVLRPHVQRRRSASSRRSLDKQDMQFLYRDGDDYVFMDTETYDQLHVPPVALGDAADYMVEQADRPIIAFYNGEIVARRDPGVGRADDHRDRAGHAGRPGVAAPASRPRWRPARSSRCRCSSTPATASGSTPAAATTSPGSDVARRRARRRRRRALRRPRAGAAAAVRGRLEGRARRRGRRRPQVLPTRRADHAARRRRRATTAPSSTR